MNLSAISATLSFLLSAAYRHLFGARVLVIEHSLGDGYFCHRDNWGSISQQEIDALEVLMRQWLEDSEPIRLETMPYRDLLDKFNSAGLLNKPAILKQWNIDPVPVIKFRQFLDYRIEAVESDKKLLQNFKLMKYGSGFILRFPSMLNPERIPEFTDHPRLFSIIEEYERWGKILKIDSINMLNQQINNGIRNLVWVAEGLHEKKIIRIADELCSQFKDRHVIFVAGPSSSGKTTFAKRLSIQLAINGYLSKQISMDDYFISRDAIPMDESGKQDFESFNVVDVDLICSRVKTLLAGKSIPERRYDFSSGTGSDQQESFCLKEKEFLIIEGIHALNPELSHRIGDNRTQRVYVSAMTQLNIDGDHRVSTSDNRLLRRMVRDYKFRGYTPEQTLERWASVRMGEERNIFPYQEQADFMFNSALVYELPVLCGTIKPLLQQISPSMENYHMVEKLLTLTQMFKTLDEKYVPGISILREFIGGSEFNY